MSSLSKLRHDWTSIRALLGANSNVSYSVLYRRTKKIVIEIQIYCLVACCVVNIVKNNILAINSSHDLAVDPLQAEGAEHAISPIGPALQVYHKHLHTFNTHTNTWKHT